MKDFTFLILARGGSKRVPNKNLIKLKDSLGGESSLLEIQIKLGLEFTKEVIVSSDSSEILKEASRAGAKILVRPERLALDISSSVESALHALEFIDTEDIILLQATCPLTRRGDILRGIKTFKKERRPVYSALECKEIFWARYWNGGPVFKDWVDKRSQDLPKVFIPSGNFFITSKGDLEKNRSFVNGGCPCLIQESSILDIDTKKDLERAKWLYLQQSEALFTSALM